MKKDEVITGLSVAWTVERFVTLSPKGKGAKEEEKKDVKKQETGKAKVSAKKKAAPAKKSTKKK